MERVQIEMKTSAEKCSEKEVLWNKFIRETVAKFMKEKWQVTQLF